MLFRVVALLTLWISLMTEISPARSAYGHILTPPASVTPSYDLDGNLTFDGVWTYTWDTEQSDRGGRILDEARRVSLSTARKVNQNRLTKAVRDLAGIPYREVRYTYDAAGRRIQRLVYHTANAPPVSTERYVHIGSRRLLTIDGSNQPIQSFLWGLDLSNTMDRAGGAGGLLAIHDHAGGDTHFACSDGNGNLTTLVNQAGTVTATYEYAPFGGLIRSTGSYAASNPYRFSTRAQDDVTGLLDYGARWYQPEWGRWLSRDPLGEFDGANPYRFLGNDPINSIDVGGGYSWEVWKQTWLNPKFYFDTQLEAYQDPDYWRDVGSNYKDVGDGVVNGVKGTIDSVASIPEIAEFLASDEAAEMIDRLINDPDFRDKMADHLGDEFCEFYNKLQTQEGIFETYGEAAFGVLTGAGALKLIKAFKAAKAAGRFAKAVPSGGHKPKVGYKPGDRLPDGRIAGEGPGAAYEGEFGPNQLGRKGAFDECKEGCGNSANAATRRPS